MTKNKIISTFNPFDLYTLQNFLFLLLLLASLFCKHKRTTKARLPCCFIYTPHTHHFILYLCIAYTSPCIFFPVTSLVCLSLSPSLSIYRFLIKPEFQTCKRRRDKQDDDDYNDMMTMMMLAGEAKQQNGAGDGAERMHCRQLAMFLAPSVWSYGEFIAVMV
jgi:hypothetical protein